MKSTGFQVLIVGIVTGAMLFFAAATSTLNKAATGERLDAIVAAPSAIVQGN